VRVTDLPRPSVPSTVAPAAALAERPRRAETSRPRRNAAAPARIAIMQTGASAPGAIISAANAASIK